MINEKYKALFTTAVVKKLQGNIEAPWLSALKNIIPPSEAKTIGPESAIVVPNSAFKPGTVVDYNPSGSGNIPSATYDVTPKTIYMRRVTTKVVSISDYDQSSYSIDSAKDVTDSSAAELMEVHNQLGMDAIAPLGPNSANSPVLQTTGAEGADGFKKLTYADLVAAKRALDVQGCGVGKRIAVLSDAHYADILEDRANFAGTIIDFNTGVIKSVAGFEVHQYSKNPSYTDAGSGFVKDAFGSATPGRVSSIFYFEPMFGKVDGRLISAFRNAEENPETQSDTMSYSKDAYYGPISQFGPSYSVALVSADVVVAP